MKLFNLGNGHIWGSLSYSLYFFVYLKMFVIKKDRIAQDYWLHRDRDLVLRVWEPARWSSRAMALLALAESPSG